MMVTLNQDPVYERTFFPCATLSHGTVQILSEIAIPVAVQKLERFRGFCVNRRRIRRASFCPLKTFSLPAEKIWEKILWCYHSNETVETSLTEPLPSIIVS